MKAVVAALAYGVLAAPAWAEPPDTPGLNCRVTQQRTAAGGLALEVAVSNASAEALTLPAGPHLVWYRDAAAEEPLERTARASRLQDVPVLLPPGETRTLLLGLTPARLDELRCNGTKPAAAALYFYRFSRWPTFRCLLQGYAATDEDGATPASCTRPATPP